MGAYSLASKLILDDAGPTFTIERIHRSAQGGDDAHFSSCLCKLDCCTDLRPHRSGSKVAVLFEGENLAKLDLLELSLIGLLVIDARVEDVRKYHKVVRVQRFS